MSYFLLSQHMIELHMWVVLLQDTQTHIRLDFSHAIMLPVILWVIKFISVVNPQVAVFSDQIQTTRHFVKSTNQLIQIKFIRSINNQNMAHTGVIIPSLVLRIFIAK